MVHEGIEDNGDYCWFVGKESHSMQILHQLRKLIPLRSQWGKQLADNRIDLHIGEPVGLNVFYVLYFDISILRR